MANRQQKLTRWTGVQRKYMEWLATPEDLRDQRKLHEFAALLGVRRETLWAWRQLPGFNAEVQVYCKQNMGDALPDVLAALKEFARRGSFPHQKMYLEMLGMYTQRTVIDINGLAERIATETNTPLGDIVAEADRILTAVTDANKGR